MKKLVCLIAVIALAAPLYADNITITATDAGNGQLRIGYTVTSGVDVPVGISMVLSLSNAATVNSAADVLSHAAEFNTFIDYANVTPGYTLGTGHPLANKDANGLPVLPSSAFALCLGSLNNPKNAPASTTNLATLQLHPGTPSGNTVVTFAPDTLRGGIFGVAEMNVTLPPPTTVTFDCFPAGYTTYAFWVTMGKPACWCAKWQCDGDADGVTSGAPFQYRIYTGDLNLVIANWKKLITNTTLNACADVDHKSSGAPFNYRVYTADLNKIIANWKKKDTGTSALPGDCPRPE